MGSVYFIVEAECESIVNPKQLKKLTYSIFMLSIFNSNFFGSVHVLLSRSYYFVFIFKANLLILSQSLIIHYLFPM